MSDHENRQEAGIGGRTAREEVGAGMPEFTSSRTVLVVDDSPDSADMMKVFLELEGYSVHVAYSGSSAASLLRDVVPAIAFLDIGLPDMSGFELARQVRADPRLSQVRLVAVTGLDRGRARQLAGETDFDDVLTKPVDPDDVVRLARSARVSRA